jgi:hypothetical protein
MLCPWCMHCGAEDEEYVFDDEWYCGICAQQMPRTDADWLRAQRALDRAAFAYIEQELNRIGASKSGLRPGQREALARAVDAVAAHRLAGESRDGPLSDEELATWLKYACTYYAPAQ